MARWRTHHRKAARARQRAVGTTGRNYCRLFFVKDIVFGYTPASPARQIGIAARPLREGDIVFYSPNAGPDQLIDLANQKET